jgi:catechol 2,3-dioxygenase-like lactoylglutathione lyase family enzyme
MLAASRLQTIVWTSRPAEAERFYGNVLGLPLNGRSHGALLYDVGGSELRVSPIPATAPSAHTVVGFAVADLDAVMAALTARGVHWERFPGLPQDGSGVLRTSEGARVAWFRDPDGNLLSIVQYP